jgi:ribosomal protein S18 acetylase RimI-like enzyme
MNQNKRLNDKKIKKKSSSSWATIPSALRIRIANECENPLLKINNCFHNFNKNGFDLSLKCYEWRELDENCHQLIIELIEQNMKNYYESSSWGWSKSKKLKELSDKTSRILILKCNKTNEIIGFVSFRFETGGHHKESALYCYELQIIETHRRYGIGRYLMSCLYEIGLNFNMNKVMLTVFKNNKIAIDFYLNALKYSIDKSSPSRFQQESDYEILSIKLNKKQIQTNF